MIVPPICAIIGVDCTDRLLRIDHDRLIIHIDVSLL